MAFKCKIHATLHDKAFPEVKDESEIFQTSTFTTPADVARCASYTLICISMLDLNAKCRKTPSHAQVP
jgi:hypothetical protein